MANSQMAFFCPNSQSVDEIAQMVEQAPSTMVQIQVREGLFFNRGKTIFAMNSGQDLNNNAETRLSDILYYLVIKAPTPC